MRIQNLNFAADINDAENEETTHACLHSTTMLRKFMKAKYEQRLQY